MHTSLYIAAAIGWIIRLGFNVINLRRKHQVSLGSESHDDLEKTIRAHANATEYLPLALIGLAAAEYGGIHWSIIHLIGIALMLGRYWHNQGITGNMLKLRVRGMYLTFFPLMAIAILNLWTWLF
jgi:uncharacterized membrane protein YecN with MAPEG domain